MRKKSGTTIEKKLPWLVELLFVQIGLPDFLLRDFLKIKKNSKKVLKSNKRSITLSAIFFLLLIYINPIIKRASLHNDCIVKTEKFISDNISNGQKYKLNEVSIVASNFCSGGKLE